MNADEFKAARRVLGYSVQRMASALANATGKKGSLHPRTVRRWERGRPIPDNIAAAVWWLMANDNSSPQ